MTAQEKINSKVSALGIKELKKMARMLTVDMREGTDVVLNAVMNELMGRLDETKFVAFCGELESLI